MSREQKARKEPYFLYVGNAYPHKNLELLVSAFGDFLKTSGKKCDLLFVGKDDYFYQRLKKKVANMGLSDAVHFLESVDDNTLRDLYTHALALVFPSFMEGFGLPALEALSLGTKIICSDIPIFHEILGSLPRYVDPYDKKALHKDCLISE